MLLQCVSGAKQYYLNSTTTTTTQLNSEKRNKKVSEQINENCQNSVNLNGLFVFVYVCMYVFVCTYIYKTYIRNARANDAEGCWKAAASLVMLTALAAAVAAAKCNCSRNHSAVRRFVVAIFIF